VISSATRSSMRSQVRVPDGTRTPDVERCVPPSVENREEHIQPSTAQTPLEAPDTSSCDDVLQLTELLETILLNLSLKEIARAKRVSRKWRNVIDHSIRLQRKMFFQPEQRQYRLQYDWNDELDTCCFVKGHPFVPLSVDPGLVINTHRWHPLLDQHKSRGHITEKFCEALINDGGSWDDAASLSDEVLSSCLDEEMLSPLREALVAQPPLLVAEVSYTFWKREYLGGHRVDSCTERIRKFSGIRFCDILEPWWSRRKREGGYSLPYYHGKNRHDLRRIEIQPILSVPIDQEDMECINEEEGRWNKVKRRG
jgi:hypothetical protein